LVVVKHKKGESVDKLIARFKKKVLNAGIVQEVRDRTRFKSKSEKKKERLAQKKHNIELEKKRKY
jgi:ribosomal protein S21